MIGNAPEIPLLDRVRADGTDLTEPIARLTRAAYAGSDPLPGLPEPDGARDTAEDVRRELAAGAEIWTLRTGGGELLAAARVCRAAGRWDVYRITVAPDRRRGGVVRTLLDRLEARAAEVVLAVRVDAVVERCLPEVYARLGYRVTSHRVAEDKPLTELTMEREPGRPRRPRRFPWHTATLLGHRWVVSWFVTPDGVAAGVDPAGDDPARAAGGAARRIGRTGGAARLAGIDLLADPAPAAHEVAARIVPGAREIAERAWQTAGVRADIAAHVMPRTVVPGLAALWRYPPGREPPADDGEGDR